MLHQDWPTSKTLKIHLQENGLRLSELTVTRARENHPNLISLSGTTEDGSSRLMLLKRYAGNLSYWEKEVFAYRGIFRADQKITPALHAAWKDSSSEIAYLILDDLSSSHRCPDSPHPDIGEAELTHVFSAYARCHSINWGRQDQWKDFFEKTACPSVSHEAVSPESITGCVDYFLNECLPEKEKIWSGHIPEGSWEVVSNAIALWANLFQNRAKMRESLTLIHGDAHLGNVLLAGKNRLDLPLLIDWAGISPGVGAWDLVRLLHHTNWSSSKIASLEPRMMEHYHKELLAMGITNYSWMDFEYDYRLSVLAYLPHSLAWGDTGSLKVAMDALSRWNALDLKDREFPV